MMATSLGIMSELIFGLFGLAFVLRLEHSEVLTRIVQDLGKPTPSSLTDAGNALLSKGFLTPFLAFMLPAGVLTIIVVILGSGFVYSAEFGSYKRALEGDRVNIPIVMMEFRKRWKPMAWTVFISYLLTLSPIILFGSAAAVVLSFGTEGLILSAFFFLIGFLGVAIVSVLLIYCPVAVSYDGLSGLRAIKKSICTFIKCPGASLIYSVVYILLSAVITAAAGMVPQVSLPLASLVSIGVLILAVPVLHLSKTSLYKQITMGPQEDFVLIPRFERMFDVSLARMIWARFRAGLTEIRQYALNKGNVVYHLAAVFSMVIGLIVGVTLGRGGIDQLAYDLGYVPGRINPLVTNSIPISLSVYIFLHNWQVSLGTALSGVFISVFPIAMLFLNGVIIGIFSTLVPNIPMLASALLPHGIIEIPSFIIAGSAGLKLGIAFVRMIKNQGKQPYQEALGIVATQTVYLVIGLALLFLIAGLIEGNITPLIMKIAGWK
jgi:stage II sporulation protein M